jgi:hypothetical protein
MQGRFSLIYLAFISTWFAQASVLLIGDPDAPEGQTFSFPINAHVLGTRLYVGANNQQGDLFSIARVNRQGTGFEGLTPERVTLNGQPGQRNPLFDAQIPLLTLQYGDMQRPVATTQTGTDLFIISDTSATNTSVLSIEGVLDAGAAPTPEIIALQGVNDLLSVVAVKGNGETNFGSGNSGIASVGLINVAEAELMGTNVLFRQLNAQPGAASVRAALLNVTTDSVKIINDLASMGNVVDLHWDAGLNILYSALHVEASGGAADGARALVAAHFTNTSELIFVPIAPDAVFNGAADKIVGAIGAGETISLHKVRTLRTAKAQLTYLIVIGGNGPPTATRRSVFALPVVNTRSGEVIDYTIQGTLADVTQLPEDVFSDPLSIFQGRRFARAAETDAHVFTDTDAAAIVGGADIPAGDIDDIFVLGDAVFVSIGTAAVGQKPGLFTSQAIVNENGVIVSWTLWRRVAGTTDQVFGANMFDVVGPLQGWDGNFITLTGSDSSSIRTIKKTIWSNGAADGSEPLTHLFAQSFDQAWGGIRSLRDYPVSLTALNGVSLIIATGHNRVVLVETGRTVSGVFCPTHGNEFKQGLSVFDSGGVEQTFGSTSTTRYIQFSGGALEVLGPITTSEIAVDSPGVNGWIVVGGTNGVTILTESDGTGWPILAGALTNGFEGLNDQMSFEVLGNFTNVRRLISDRGFLYVLTDTTLDRIDISASDFGTNTLSLTTLARFDEFTNSAAPGTFLDLLVSEKLVLLATSVGVFRNGNGTDVATAVDSVTLNWTLVDLPNSVPPVLQLLPFSTTGIATDVARSGGGQVYVLDAYAGSLRAQINRLAIADTSISAITSTSVIPFNDLATETMNSFFVTFRGFREYMDTDGAVFLSTQDKDVQTEARLFAGTDILSTIIPLDLGSLSNGPVTIVRSSASGSWLVAGDFGLRVSE